MATLATLKREVIALLGEDVEENSDPIAGTDTPAEVLLQGCHAALLALASKYWKPAVLEVEADPDEKQITIPDDYIEAEAVYDEKLSLFIPRLFFRVGDTITGASVQNSWYDYPKRTLTLVNPFTAGGKIFYSAHWALPTDDSDEIETPNICLTFLQLHATSYCLLRKANEQGSNRVFLTKVDAGNPIQIPAEKLSNFFMQRAEAELQRLPMKQKGI